MWCVRWLLMFHWTSRKTTIYRTGTLLVNLLILICAHCWNCTKYKAQFVTLSAAKERSNPPNIPLLNAIKMKPHSRRTSRKIKKVSRWYFKVSFNGNFVMVRRGIRKKKSIQLVNFYVTLKKTFEVEFNDL